MANRANHNNGIGNSNKFPGEQKFDWVRGIVILIIFGMLLSMLNLNIASVNYLSLAYHLILSIIFVFVDHWFWKRTSRKFKKYVFVGMFAGFLYLVLSYILLVSDQAVPIVRYYFCMPTRVLAGIFRNVFDPFGSLFNLGNYLIVSLFLGSCVGGAMFGILVYFVRNKVRKENE